MQMQRWKRSSSALPFRREMTVGASHEEGGANTFPEQYTEKKDSE